MTGLHASNSFVRMVGGDLVSSRITNTETMRIEVLRRISRPKMEWHFRQPEVTLFWFRQGAENLRGRIDGCERGPSVQRKCQSCTLSGGHGDPR